MFVDALPFAVSRTLFFFWLDGLEYCAFCWIENTDCATGYRFDRVSSSVGVDVHDDKPRKLSRKNPKSWNLVSGEHLLHCERFG